MTHKIATSNEDAIQRVEDRLKADVGGLFDLIFKEWKRGNTITPNWAFARMIFPISESLGDLKYNLRPTENQYQILKNEYAQIDRKYEKVSAILSQLFRHSLIHQDELRYLRFYRYSKIVWKFKISDTPDNEHLKITKASRAKWRITFNVYQFYLDTLRICTLLKGTLRNPEAKGQFMHNYNNWTEKDFGRTNISGRSINIPLYDEFESIRKSYR